MSFLAPLFLVGALAISLPVLFHLSRRATRTRTAFSSLMFLLPTAPRLTRRSRLEQWLLLLLRCLALALLAFGFARPFFKDGTHVLPLAAVPRHVVVLLDISASLQREGLWADALSRADEVIRSLQPTDHLAVIAFAREARTALGFSEWDATPADARATLARARLASLAPCWEGTHLGRALVTAADAFSDVDHDRQITGRREIVLVSDVQAGSRLEDLQSYEWPKGVTLKVASVFPRRIGNAGVQLIAGATDGGVNGTAPVRIRVINTRDAAGEQFSLVWKRGAETVGKPIQVYVPPGQSRIVSMEVQAGVPGLDRIELGGDAVPFDNTVFVTPPEKQRLRIAYFGGEPAADPTQPLFFLKRALESSPRVQVDVVPVAGTSETPDLAMADAAFVTGMPSAGQAAALRRWIESGRTLVAAPKSADVAVSLAGVLAGVTLAAEDTGVPGGYAMWGEIDFKHPLFAAFADPRFSDFTKIHVWKHRRFQPAGFKDARIVARFDSGDPAVIEAPLGRGRIVWLTSGWQPEDSQLAVSSKFVPLVWSLLDHAGVTRREVVSLVVGDVLPLPATEGAQTVVSPDGRSHALDSGAVGFAGTLLPGIYRVGIDGREARFAVNLDPNESKTDPLSLDDREQLGVPARSTVADSRVEQETGRRAASLRAVETEGRQKLWRWFLLATLAVLLTETIVAARTVQKKSTAGEALSS